MHVRESRVARDRLPAGKTWPCTRGARCQKFAGASTRNEFLLQPLPIKHHACHPAHPAELTQPLAARSARLPAAQASGYLRPKGSRRGDPPAAEADTVQAGHERFLLRNQWILAKATLLQRSSSIING